MQDEEMYALWPCGLWCEIDEIEEYLSWVSDDFKVVTASEIPDLNEPI